VNASLFLVQLCFTLRWRPCSWLHTGVIRTKRSAFAKNGVGALIVFSYA
jgi:hypothetical protein